MTSGYAPANRPVNAKGSKTIAPTIYPEYCHDISPTLLKWCPLRAVDIHALRDVGMFVDDMRLYHFLNHPIKWIKIVGVVVAVDDFWGRKVYTVDDGSGMCIECSCVVPMTSTDVDAVLGVPKHLDQGMRALDTTTSRPRVAITAIQSETNKVGAKVEGKADAKLPESVQNPKVPWDSIDAGTVIKVKGRVGAFRAVKNVEVVRIEVQRGTDSEVRFWDEAGVFRRGVLGSEWILKFEEVEALKKKREREVRRARKGKEDGKDKEKLGNRDKGKEIREGVREEDGDTARMVLEEESGRRRVVEGEGKRKRKEMEKRERHEDKIKRRKERDVR